MLEVAGVDEGEGGEGGEGGDWGSVEREGGKETVHLVVGHVETQGEKYSE